MTFRLRPSAAHRWSNCPAEPSFAALAPKQPTSDAAREGTCAAWMAEAVLIGDAPSTQEMIGKVHPNGWECDADMAIATQDYCDHVLARGEVMAEHKVEFTDEISGTLDSAFHAEREGVLYVTDFKYGYLPVEVFNNPQLIIYAWGLVGELSVKGVELIQLEIYQPRAIHHDGIIRKWVISYDELEQYAQDLRLAAAACQRPNPLAKPGSHCTYCPAAVGCESLAHTTYTMAHTLMSPEYRDLTIEQLAQELNFMEEAETVMKARFKAIAKEGEARAKTDDIPGWRMVSRKGHRKFTVDAKIIETFTGISATEEKLITPAEAIRRGADKIAIDAMSEQPSIGHKLTRVTREKVAQIFSRKEI